jgi:predicted unusual protein kinase regulating ubiquinone biosynthesis (AarF/ABC1/UbiB family)
MVGAQPSPYGRVMAGAPPTSRLARTGRVGGLVAGQGLRWAGTRAANTLRSDEKADAATGERAAATARELVKQLGQMRGAAMKIGQVLSTVDFTAIPAAEREEFKRTLATLRDDVPPLPFAKIERLVKTELGGSLSRHFAEFDEDAFAAASIGQVHRAVTRDGDEVAVKIQYPGMAEAVEIDLRNLSLLLPLVKRLAPGLDVKALAAELRERVGEELDYEIEAQNHRSVARAWRGHPFAHVPAVYTSLSSRRVLVTELLSGRRFEDVKQLPDAERDRFAEIVFRFFFGTLNHLGRASGDPHPGNYLLLDDGRVGFLDFGLMRMVDPSYLDRERAVARAVVAGDALAVHAGMRTLGYLPDPGSFEPERLLAQLRLAGEWYFEPGARRITPEYVSDLMERSSSPRSEYFDDLRRMTLPPQALLIRRMEGLVFSTLGELRAQADWAALGDEYHADAASGTALGELDQAFWGDRGTPLARAA